MERVPEAEAIAEPLDAARFNTAMKGNRFAQEGYRQLARMVAGMGIPPGARVLDVGTGTGFAAIALGRALKGTGSEIVGMDLSEAMLSLAAENAAEAGLQDPLTWRRGDAKAMPFGDGEFDAVISSGSLHHWDDPPAVFDEIARVLKADGRCVVNDSKRLQSRLTWAFVRTVSLTVPRDFRVHWWNSIRSSYTPRELQTMLRDTRLTGWKIEEYFLDLAVVKV